MTTTGLNKKSSLLFYLRRARMSQRALASLLKVSAPSVVYKLEEPLRFKASEISSFALATQMSRDEMLNAFFPDFYEVTKEKDCE